MTLPKAISDAIDAYGSAVAWVQDDARQDTHDKALDFARETRAGLERAIEDHVAKQVQQATASSTSWPSRSIERP